MTRTAPAAIVNASARYLVSLGAEGRADADAAREAHLHEVEAELYRVQLQAANLRREVELAKTGQGVSHILANSDADPLHERLPGDILTDHSGREWALIGVKVDRVGGQLARVFYFVARLADYEANLGDGLAPVWKRSDNFRRP